MIYALLLIVSLLVSAPLAHAQDHKALTMRRPLPVGSAPTGLDAANRIYRAYQGIPYGFKVQADGGEWPYTYSFTGGSNPSGMTIEAGPCTTVGPTCTAGTISWPSPDATDSSITVQVCDRDSDCVSATWGVTVSTTIGAGGFCFLDGDAAGGGNGSPATPYNSIAAVWSSGNCAGAILYIRNAATDYVVTGMTETTPGDCERQVAWHESLRPIIWIGYPGETATIDFGFDGTSAPCMELQGENLWIENLTLHSVGSIGFQVIREGRYGVVVRKITGTSLEGGFDGANSSYFMWSINASQPSYGDTVEESYFDNVQGSGQCALKIYSVQHGIFETSRYGDSTHEEAMIAIKAEVPDITVRANICDADCTTFIGGNMNGDDGTMLQSSGEILHNVCRGSDTGFADGCLTIGVAKVLSTQNNGPWHVYRNTWVGKLNLQNVETQDGLNTFTRNVTINAGGSGSPAVCTSLRAICTTINDATRIVDSGDSLGGASGDGFVNSDGELINTAFTNHGPESATPKGHMLGSGSGSGGGTSKTPRQVLPRRLRADDAALDLGLLGQLDGVAAQLWRAATTGL